MKKGAVLSAVFLLISSLVLWSALWYLRVCGPVGFDAILFTLTGGMTGVAGGLVLNYMLGAALPALPTAFLLWAMLWWPWKEKKPLFPLTLPGWARRLISVVLVLGMLAGGAAATEFPRWLSGKLQTGDLYERHYADPAKVSVTFPEEKRNLIYIFLESMETTYLSNDLGGGVEQTLIPELYELARDNINFSHNSGVGGWSMTSGTNWTIGAMVAQTGGVALSDVMDESLYGEQEAFLPGAVTINDILRQNGYRQALMVGSDSSFAGRSTYFTQHGVDKVYDLFTAWEDGIVEDGREVWWGLEDKYLFQYAKQVITQMAEDDAPFAFTMLTVDTHHVDGYLCEACGDTYDSQYANVLSCSSAQVGEFVEWLKEQPFYENTTVVICGDHQSMDNAWFEEHMEEGFERRVYNCILNSAAVPQRAKNRSVTPFDLYPTTLAAMGCTIEGNRLGLGVNLFSNLPTLAERYGSYLEMNLELEKQSDYYDRKLQMKQE